MIVVRKNAPRPQRRVELYEGVVLIGPPLDARQHKALFVAADRDLEAVRTGAEAVHAWNFTDAEIAALNADEDLRATTRQWMRSVLLVEAFAQAVEGVRTEAGADVTKMDFDLALYLMCDARFEAKFRYLGGETERLYGAEKKD